MYARFGIALEGQMANIMELSSPKPVRWVGSSRDDLRKFPEDVRNRIGGALWEAQLGRKAPYARPLKGFGGAGVLEVMDDFNGDTYRAVYTVRFVGVVLRAPCLSEEVKERDYYAPPRDHLD